MNLTSDYIDFDKALNKGFSLLSDEKKAVIGFYIVFSINTGLRISDILKLKHNDLLNDKLTIVEKKTKKVREIQINQAIRKAYSKLQDILIKKDMFNDDGFVFVSQKGSVYKTQSINAILKKIFNSKKLQISSHSLRKSFARRVYSNNNESENALVLLSDIFSHSSIAITRRYLGIRQETIDNVYLSL